MASTSAADMTVTIITWAQWHHLALTLALAVAVHENDRYNIDSHNLTESEWHTCRGTALNINLIFTLYQC